MLLSLHNHEMLASPSLWIVHPSRCTSCIPSLQCPDIMLPLLPMLCHYLSQAFYPSEGPHLSLRTSLQDPRPCLRHPHRLLGRRHADTQGREREAAGPSYYLYGWVCGPCVHAEARKWNWESTRTWWPRGWLRWNSQYWMAQDQKGDIWSGGGLRYWLNWLSVTRDRTGTGYSEPTRLRSLLSRMAWHSPVADSHGRCYCHLQSHGHPSPTSFCSNEGGFPSSHQPWILGHPA